MALSGRSCLVAEKLNRLSPDFIKVNACGRAYRTGPVVMFDSAANGRTAVDTPRYIPEVTFSGNTSDSPGAIIDVAGWYYTSPTYADLRYTQQDRPAADAAKIAIWNITSDGERTGDGKKKTSSPVQSRPELNIQ